MIQSRIGYQWTIVKLEDGQAFSGTAAGRQLTNAIIGNQFAV